jgi:hypothetical protein
MSSASSRIFQTKTRRKVYLDLEYKFSYILHVKLNVSLTVMFIYLRQKFTIESLETALCGIKNHSCLYFVKY